MVYTVAICDDEEVARNELVAYLDRMSDEFGCEFRVQSYASGLEFLSDRRAPVDILLLDVQMPGMDGFTVARDYAKEDQCTCLIFITNYPNLAIEGYRVHAWNYVAKPVSYPSFCRVVLSAIRHLSLVAQPSVNIKTADGIMRLQVRDIRYIEASHGKVLIHSQCGDVSCLSTLRSLEDELASKGFYRTHKAFLVNLYHIVKITATDTVLTDGSVVPLSRNMRSGLKEAFAMYLGDIL